MGLWEKGCLGVVGGFCVVEGVLGRIVAIADCLATLRMAKKGTANATAGSFDCAQERLFDCAVRKVRFLWVSKEQATATAKCGGLSAAQQTMRLSVASVEMTPFRQGGRKAAKATHEACSTAKIDS
jgi:hypothetical protein